MTSLSTIRTDQPGVEGRSVRDIVETNPELVNEVWCRKIFRQILQSLELQYAMQMPHRAITADTIVFHENGEPLLVPVRSGAPAVGEPSRDESADLAALAGIIHYAITHELMPTGPLRGRAPEGYSDSLVTAVDRCMSPDPAQRPRSIDELREILGIVALGPSAVQLASSRTTTPAPPATAAPASAARTASPAAGAARQDGTASFMQGGERTGLGAGLSRWQRWSLAVGGGAALLAIALAMFAELRDSGSYDHIVLTLPQAGDGQSPAGAPARAPGPAPAASAGASASAGAPATPASVEPAGPAPATQDGAPQPASAMAPPAGPAATSHAPAAAMPAQPHNAAQATRALAQNPPAAPADAPVPPGGGSYRLRIAPWGVVYVDGVDHGVSPPLKRLVLAPGRHTLRVANPAFPDRLLEVDTARGDGTVTVNFNDDGN